MNEEPDYDYSVNLTIEDIHLLHHCVLKRIDNGTLQFWFAFNSEEVVKVAAFPMRQVSKRLFRAIEEDGVNSGVLIDEQGDVR